MKNRLPDLDLDPYPPFTGFPKKGLVFLRQLKRNNRRDWFENHREDYETTVKLPMQSLIAALQPHFSSFAPEFEVNPKRSLFRIYRDVRFSKDKSPYKTHVAAHFVPRGKPKGIEGSGYYLHIEPAEVFVGAGIYMPDGDQLKRIRKAIASEPAECLALIKNPALKKIFGKIEGERLRRVPRGYSPDHPMAEWLRLKQFFVGASFAVGKCHTPRFAEDVARVFKIATPLVRFLNEAMK
jgi:uncharacterized protein (TIGR02453 family)